MTEEPQEGSTGAPFHDVTDWHAIDWEPATRQCASASSTHRQGNKGKEMGQGESLATPLNPLVQRQSPCRATSDGKPGQNTPGVDKITWNTPHKKTQAVYSLRQRGYHPQPLRRIYIPRKMAKHVH